MQAIYLHKRQVLFTTDYPKPEPGVREALIRVLLAGVCSTDIEMTRGYKSGFGGVMGHEFVGIVEQVADEADQDWVGRRVVGVINVLSANMMEGLSYKEAERKAKHHPARGALGIFGRDGVFADYVTLPVQNLWGVPDSVSDEQAVFTEPLAAALEIREQLQIRPSVRAAVVGPGRLGSLCGAVLCLDGADVTMLGRRESSLQLARKWGMMVGLTADCADASFDLIVEATGNEAGLAEALRLIRPQGTIVLKSTFAGETSFDLTKVVVSEISLVGSRCGPFGPALRLLERGGIPVEDMIDGCYPLRAGYEALVHAGRSGVRKILLTP